MGRSAVLAVAILAASAARADFDPDAYPRHETCALCHGLFGVSRTDRFPHLGGQEPAYLEAQIRAFLSGARSNDGGQMAAIVTELVPGDIEAVVAWFASQDAPAPVEPGDAAQASEGAALYADAGCGACHDHVGTLVGVPHLRAQHAGYLAKQMRDFRDGRRGPGSLDVPHGALLPAAEEAIAAIAAYLASEPRE